VKRSECFSSNIRKNEMSFGDDMADEAWLKEAFKEGYGSGDILSAVPNSERLRQEVLIGGSYAEIFRRAALPFIRPDSHVLELGPGKGSWTRAILEFVDTGTVETVDFANVSEWLKPEESSGKLICHQVEDFSFSCIGDESVDFFWSFGVLCHHTIEQIVGILSNSKAKMKRGGVAVHEYADWNKFFTSGRMALYPDFNKSADEDHWWPSNHAEAMANAAEKAGWHVLAPDMNLCDRDGIILLKAL